MRIVCVGEATIDDYLDLNQQFVGGISLNFAINARQCGAEAVSLVSCVGPDLGGQRVLTRLAQEAVEASHVAVLPGKTPCQAIHITAEGERVFPPGGFRPGVLTDFQLSPADLDFICQHDILAAPLYRQIEPIFDRVVRHAGFRGMRVADFLNGSDYDRAYDRVTTYLDHLDLIFISGTQATIEAMQPISRHYQGLIVVTLGAGGSTALVEGQTIHQPALAVTRPLDSTGCGDAFQAAFTVTYSRSGQIEAALYQGARQAATVLQHYGAVS